ncbi:sulfurtransferase TusA family protein [uncultured Roseovarius sp.]|uniref:sulfurtransferase TusA family protein n=1 Tax=uncultured Roseovarius sp. TaxID=293344 RepID=UPI0025EE0156|nr:sulfurtransferase TusA family protein [uncultured Roseovarius sp.]
MEIAETLDARGLLCPLPVLKLRKRMVPLAAGDCIEMLADDPAAVVDVPHFCAEAGHEVVNMREADGHQIYVVRKAG